MNRFLKAAAGAACAMTVLFTGVTVFADEDKKTPTGTAYKDIGSSIEKWTNEHPDEYVSFVTAVFDKEQILYEGAFGQTDRENNVACKTDSVFEWGSVSKLTVWVSAMQLYEQGRLDLNADVRTYLPEGFFSNLKYDDPITMINLMNHDAGWGESTWNLQVDNTVDVVPLGEALKATEPPQMYRPGEVCSYSNWGAALAGYVIECITGQSYADYVHQNIFEPLGMEHTSILPDHSDNAWVQQKRPELYSYTNYGNGWNNNGLQLLYINLYPAGAVTGTIGDMAKFAQSFVREDHPLFAKKETLDLLLSPSSYLGETGIPNSFHGLWQDTYENCTMLGHDGGTNCCSSFLKFDKDTGFGAVFMTSSGGQSSVIETMFGNPSVADVKSLAGTVSKPGSLAGYYAGCRSIRKGFYKAYGLISLLPVTYKGDNTYDAMGMASIRQLSDNVCELEQGNTYPAYVYTTSDGSVIFTLGSQSFVRDNTILPSIVLLVIYAVMTFASAFMVLGKIISLIARKLEGYKGLVLITVSQVIRPAVIAPVIALLTSYQNLYGITRAQGYMVFGIEAACLVLFAATLISSAVCLFSKSEEKGPVWKYILSIAGNGLSIALILILELVNIWGI